MLHYLFVEMEGLDQISAEQALTVEQPSVGREWSERELEQGTAGLMGIGIQAQG